MIETDPGRNRLGNLLIEKGLITAEQLDRALADQKKMGGYLGYCLVRAGILTPKVLADFFASNPQAGRIQEEATERQNAANLFPRSLALYYKIAPIKVDGKDLTVALCEVEHPHLIHTLAEITGYRINPLICPEGEIRSLIESGYVLPPDPGMEFSSFDDNAFVITDTKKSVKALASSQLKKDTHAADRLRSMIAQAIKEKCREIVVKPGPDHPLVFFKKETLKESDFPLTAEQLEDLAFLLFRLSKINPFEHKKPQSGRFLVSVNDRKLTMTVSAANSMYGIRLRMEIFDEKVLRHTYEDLIAPFSELRASFEHFLDSAQKGMFAITGPESSGRTLFLYSSLVRSKEKFKNIVTLETSMRYPLAGIHQEEVSDQQMETVLEELSNRPPELLALNSIRTVRQAELAFLLAARIPVLAVFSSFDSFKLVDWLCSHNLKSPVKAGLLHTVISPRVVARICPYCSVPLEFDGQSMQALARQSGAPLKMNQGCEHCRGLESAVGQTFFETFRLNDEAITWILTNHIASFLRKQARAAGRKTLYDLISQDAVQKRLDMLSVAKLQAAL